MAFNAHVLGFPRTPRLFQQLDMYSSDILLLSTFETISIMHGTVGAQFS